MKTPDPEIFIRAAELIDRGKREYACVAIDFILKRQPIRFSWQAKWFQELLLGQEHRFFTSKSHRVFALLLAAEIAKEGGL